MVPAQGLTRSSGQTAPASVAILTGPTASGKSAFALEYARENGNIELINADSVIVYKGMDIGSAKPTREEQAKVPHHLVDIREPDEQFTAGEFFRATHEAIQQVEARGKRALIVGGTGFYLKTLLFGLWKAPAASPELRERLEKIPNPELYRRLQEKDPAAAIRIGAPDRYRLIRALEMIELTGKTVSEIQKDAPQEPDPRFALLVLDRPTEELNARISARTGEMLQQGLIEEVKALEARFPEAAPLSAVGYAQVRDYLAYRLPPGRKIKAGLEGLREEIELATRQLVKRQRTWFRGMLRKPGQSVAENFVLEADREKLLQRLRQTYETPQT